MIETSATPALKYDPFKELDQRQFERLFDDSSKQAELRRYFGDEAYQDIVELRRHARRQAVRHPELALILPGIMGSELSLVSVGGEDLVWINYWDVLTGELFRLQLAPGGSGETVRASGVLRRYYYKLKVLMESLGYEAEFFPFDWRLSIRDSEKKLTDYIQTTGRPVHLVAHSMGGLVARAAAAPNAVATTLIEKVVMLGTPNYGSFSPVLAFRGSHDIARKIAFLDMHHSNDDYRSQLFMGFPGLYEMLPAGSKSQTADLFDLANWPADEFMLSTAYLNEARTFQQTLFAGDDRFYLIAGVNNETIVSARPDAENQQFVYQKSIEGDGTVPLSCCLLAGVPTYYSNTDHGGLPNDKTVGYAAYDLLREGSTTSLETRWTPKPSLRRSEETMSDADLLQQPLNIDRDAPSDRQIRELLAQFMSVETAPAPAPIPFVSVLRPTAGAARQIEIKVTQGNLINVEAPAYVLALYADVTPTVAARFVDRAMGGTLVDQIRRGEFDGRFGRISFVPTKNTKLLADFVVFAGLGPITEFGASQLYAAAEALAEAFAEKGIQEIATLPIGLGTGLSVQQVVEQFAGGLLEGLAKFDPKGVVQRITFCDLDSENCQALRRELFFQSEGQVLNGFQIRIITGTVPSLPKGQAITEDKEPVYLKILMGEQTEQDGENALGPSEYVVEAALLADGRDRGVEISSKAISGDALRMQIAAIGRNAEISHEFGVALSTLLLAPEIISGLERALKDEERPLILLHDRAASIVPWETLSFDWRRYPSTNIAMSRHYLVPATAVAHGPDPSEQRSGFSVLLVVDPSGNLEGARREGERIKEIFEGSSLNAKITKLYQSEATKERLLSELKSGHHDIVHYAGHAFFDPENPRRSGLICAGDEPLIGEDIAGIRELPALIFFNACEAGRLRRGRDGATQVEPTVEHLVERNVGLAEAFLRNGALNYLGTYWPVGDEAARIFATQFYQRLLNGICIGEAVYRARQEVLRSDRRDWADYIHYGKPNYRLKPPSG